jgi:membrane dipeptidase
MPHVTIEEAESLHRTLITVDGHNDVPVERLARKGRLAGWEERDPAYHTDIPRMKEGNLTCAFFIVGSGGSVDVRVGIEQMLRSIEEHPNDLLLVDRSGDVEKAHAGGRIGVLMAIEGAARWLDGKLDVLGLYHRLGVRAVGITHGEGGGDAAFLQQTKSPFGPCTAADRENERKNAGGLTDFGKAFLEESNARGLVTDLSHTNDKAFFQVLERSRLPVVMSHTAVFSQCPHWRCLTDDQIKALAQNDGVMGVSFVPGFIDREKPTVERVVDHICYAADLVGMDHVGIGSDFDGIGRTVPLVEDVSRLAVLTRAMMERGLSEADIRKVWGGNFLRVFRKVLDLPRR